MSMKKQEEMGLEQLWVWAVGTSILCGKNEEERMGRHTSNWEVWVAGRVREGSILYSLFDPVWHIPLNLAAQSDEQEYFSFHGILWNTLVNASATRVSYRLVMSVLIWRRLCIQNPSPGCGLGSVSHYVDLFIIHMESSQ